MRNLIYFLIIIFLSIHIFTPYKSFGEEKIFSFPFQEFSLSNGMKVLMVQMKGSGVISYFTVVRAGSRNELEDGKTGFAHFFEHMMFRGTKSFPEKKYKQILKTLGADYNAWTDLDETVYICDVTADALDTLILLESDRFKNLTYTEQGFKAESGAILGEYNVSASNPETKINEIIHSIAFKKHPYNHTEMGTLSDIKNMTNLFEYSLTFKDRFYRPSNCILIIVGDLSFDKTERQIKAHYGDWEKLTYAQDIPKEPVQKEERRIHLDWNMPTSDLLLIGYKKPGFDLKNIEHPALEILSEILFSKDSDIYENIVQKNRWADEITVNNSLHVDPHLFIIQIVATSKEGREKAEKAIYSELEKVKDGKITHEKIKNAASHIKNRLILSMESSRGIAYHLSKFASLTGNPLDINNYYSLYDKITVGDIKNVARKIFVNEGRTVVTLSYKQK